MFDDFLFKWVGPKPPKIELRSGLGVYWEVLGVTWGLLGRSWRRLEASWGRRGRFWRRLEGDLGRLGRSCLLYTSDAADE